MVYCRSTQLREKTMASYEQALRLFERWCADELRIFTVDKVTEPVIRKYIEDSKNTDWDDILELLELPTRPAQQNAQPS